MATLRDILGLMQEGHWTEAHNRVQDDGSALAAWLHGILHVQEGDLEDAEYWYGNANRRFRERGTLEQEVERFKAALIDHEAQFPGEAGNVP